MQHIHAASPSAPAMLGVGEPTRVAHSPTKIFGRIVAVALVIDERLRFHFLLRAVIMFVHQIRRAAVDALGFGTFVAAVAMSLSCGYLALMAS